MNREVERAAERLAGVVNMGAEDGGIEYLEYSAKELLDELKRAGVIGNGAPTECPSCAASREEARLMGERLQEALERVQELEER